MTRRTALFFGAAPLLLIAAPVTAQDAPAPDPDRYTLVTVYGDDDCPESSNDEIVVCARLDEGERFRIPRDLRDNPNAISSQSWTQRVEAYERVGASGTDSCSPVGAGGFTGCTQQLVRNAAAERASAPEVQYGRLIEEARAERLSTIDAEAADTQARVEEIEKQYEERERARLEAEQGAAEAAEGAVPTPPEE